MAAVGKWTFSVQTEWRKCTLAVCNDGVIQIRLTHQSVI